MNAAFRIQKKERKAMSYHEKFSKVSVFRRMALDCIDRASFSLDKPYVEKQLALARDTMDKWWEWLKNSPEPSVLEEEQR